MRRVLTASTILIALLAVPGFARAADPCGIRFTPSTVHVGQTFVITGTGFGSNESLTASIDADYPYDAEAIWTVDATGNLWFKLRANKGELGTRTWTVNGDIGGCTASANLTVLAAPDLPSTDTVAVAPAHPQGSLWALFVLLLIGGSFAFRWRANAR